MNKKPLVSILMPNRNMSAWIDEAIESIRQQSFEDWQLIIVDDSSSDDSPQRAERHCAEDSRIELLRLPRSLGPREARNRGTNRVCGRYVAFLDSDDYWLPDKLRLQVATLRESNATLCYAAYRRIDEKRRPINEMRVPKTISYQQLLYLNVIHTSTAIYDRERAGKVYNFHPQGTCDYILWLHLLRQYGPAVGVQQPLAVYRMRNTSVSSNKLRTAIQRWRVYRCSERMSWVHSSLCSIIYIARALMRDLPHRGIALGIGTKAP